MILGLRGNLPKEHWDGLQTKDELYREFDNMQDMDKFMFAKDPEQPEYYKDGEFKAVANSIKDSVKKLLAVLPDITDHFTDSEAEKKRVQVEAQNLFNDFNFDRPDEIAKFAWLVYKALDMDNVNSFYGQIESGNGIPEARAAYRAFARYRAFKDEDKAKLEAFKRTSEYHIQATEIKLGLRSEFEMPE